MATYNVAYLMTPIEFGGAEQVNLTFLKHVDRNKFRISPILLVRPWEEENLFIRELREFGYPLCKVPVALKKRGEGKDYLRIARCYRLIHSFLRGNRFDLLHTHGYFADIVGIPTAKMLGIPSITTCHGFIMNDINLKLYINLDIFVLRFADKVIAVSSEIRNDLMKSGIKESSIGLIQNAVDGEYDTIPDKNKGSAARQAFNIREQDFVLGYTGRLSKEKGLVHLIEAAAMLDSLGIPVRVLLIGEGPERKRLENLAGEKNIGTKVHFTGFQSNVNNWLPALDAFVLPSLTEGTPMSLLEAMASGVPSIATSVGGIPGVIRHREDGILVAPGCPEEIKKAALMLYTDQSLRNSISLAGRIKVKSNHNVGDWTRRLEAEYLRVLKKHTVHNGGKD